MKEHGIQNWMRILHHDLRGHVANLVATSEYLLEEQVPPEVTREFLLLINNDSKKVLKMIEDYLLFEKIEKGQGSLKKVPINIIKLREEIKKIFFNLRVGNKLLFSLKKHGADVVGIGFLQKEIVINDSLFSSLIMNLLRNASEASPNKDSEISVNIYEADELLCISFSNYGKVPEDMRDKLFQQFATSKKKGTGLGLYGAKLITQAHGGTIDYEPLEGGTRFIVKIPFA